MAMVGAQSQAFSTTEPINGMFSLRDVFVQGFYNARLVLGCLAFGLLVGIVAALLSPPQFTAQSLLEALPEIPDVIAPQPPQVLGAEQILSIAQSDAHILQSDAVIAAAVQKVGLDRLKDLGALPFIHRSRVQSLAKTVEAFKKALKVTTEPTSTVIHANFSSRDSQLSADALNALIAAFSEQRAAVNLNPALGPQGQTLAHYAAELQQVDAAIQQLGAQHGVLDLTQDTQLANARLDNLTQRLSQARERASAVDAELGATAHGVAAVPTQVFQSQDTTNTTNNDDSRNALLRLRQDRAHLAAQYTDAWPGVRELDAKIAAAQAQISSNVKDRYFTDRTQRNPVLDQLDSRLSNLKIEHQSLASETADLNQQIRAAQARIAELRDVSGQMRDLQRRRDVADGIYRQLSLSQAGATLRNRVDSLQGGGFRVIEPPTPPAKPHSLRLTFLIGGVLLGVVLAAAACGAATLGRQVFITPGEAARTLRLPALAHFDARESDVATPEGRAAVARFATLLADTSVDGKLLQVIQFVATDANTKSDFALELGRAMAEDQSQRTLLVDFDAEARYRDLAAESPAVRTLGSEGAALTVARSATPKLWLTLDAMASPLGDPRRPIAEVKAGLEAIRPHFDRILIVARSAVNQYAARRLYALADANVLMVRAERSRALAARQLKETVLSAGGDILGFVFTHRGYYIPEALYRWL